VAADAVTYLETVLQVSSSGPGDVSGQIVNALTGAGVGGLTVQLRAGLNTTSGEVLYTSLTQSGGTYAFTGIEAGNYTAEAGGSAYNTAYFTVTCVGGVVTPNQNATISPVIASGETRIVLTWGTSPSDLDSHLTGPTPDENRFHIYYSAKTYSYGGVTYASLDRDCTTGQGPETTAIFSLNFSGLELVRMILKSVLKVSKAPSRRYSPLRHK